MAKEKEAKDPHIYGKVTGCGYKPKGQDRYQVAPAISGEFIRIELDRKAIELLVQSINQYAQREFRKCADASRKLWDKLFADLEIPRGSGQLWEYNDGEFYRVPEKEKEAKNG